MADPFPDYVPTSLVPPRAPAPQADRPRTLADAAERPLMVAPHVSSASVRQASRLLLAHLTPAAAWTVRDVMLYAKDARDRLAAANIVLERTYGRAPDSRTLLEDEERATSQSDADLLAEARRVVRALGDD